jgi:8-oxo-dGTP pyrophosphatase MutT (NUDIX family)
MSRTIHLRRPPTLQLVEGVFVPPVERLEEVDRRWAALCRANPAYFDGRVCHVLGVHRNGCGGAVLHVIDAAYRFYAVQDEIFDVGMRSLGVKGLTVRRGRVLMGRRGPRVAACQGQWEFAPGGAVEPGRDPARVVLEELHEETGLAACREPTAVALLFDSAVRCWELVYRIEAGEETAAARTDEYDRLQWCRPGELPGDLSPVARRMVGMVEGLRD